MAIWMEIRCEARTQDFPGVNCDSMVNAGPMGMAGETQLGVIEGLRDLADQATRGGWEKMKAGWVCPACANHMRTNNIPASVLDV
jgi:hypothetical protein